MITSDRGARMLLGCAMDAGDPAVADLVQNLGADAAWAKITEGALGEPAAERAALLSLDLREAFNGQGLSKMPQ
jgi:DNA processing protein